MQDQTLLFVMGSTFPKDDLQENLKLAKSQNARVVCLILAQLPTYPLNAYGALPYGGMGVPSEWVSEVEAAKQKLADTTEKAQTILQSEGVSGEVHGIHCALADVRDIVAQRALVCDVATVASNLRVANPDLFKAAIYGVLFESPIGLVLNAPALKMPKRVFIAWNTELPASRALHLALPILRNADEVIVGSVDPQLIESGSGEDCGADLAKWLSHHGCNTTVSQYPSGGLPTSTIIRRHAAEVGADLIVMGAFGRSRLREFIFGGTTQAMLEQSDAALFMAH